MFRRNLTTAISLLLLPLAPALAQTEAETESHTAAATGPDLQVTLASPMENTVTVRNVGNADAVGTRVEIGCKPITFPSAPSFSRCVQGATFSNTNDREATTSASVDLPPLAAGETTTVSVPYWRQLTLEEWQGYHFKATVDPDGLLDEPDEDNNVARSFRGTAPTDMHTASSDKPDSDGQ